MQQGAWPAAGDSPEQKAGWDPQKSKACRDPGRRVRLGLRVRVPRARRLSKVARGHSEEEKMYGCKWAWTDGQEVLSEDGRWRGY